ncbi:hypothetical protein AAMO2058_000308500, partial [Amorphochlora amoebiformis]
TRVTCTCRMAAAEATTAFLLACLLPILRAGVSIKQTRVGHSHSKVPPRVPLTDWQAALGQAKGKKDEGWKSETMRIGGVEGGGLGGWKRGVYLGVRPSKRYKKEVAERVAEFLLDTFGVEQLAQGTGVFEIAGGSGYLSAALRDISDGRIPVTMIDPKPNLDYASKHLLSDPGFELIPRSLTPELVSEISGDISEASLVVSIYPHEVTEAVADFSKALNLPAVIVPCCPLPGMTPSDPSTPIDTVEQLAYHLQHRDSALIPFKIKHNRVPPNPGFRNWVAGTARELRENIRRVSESPGGVVDTILVRFPQEEKGGGERVEEGGYVELTKWAEENGAEGVANIKISGEKKGEGRRTFARRDIAKGQDILSIPAELTISVDPDQPDLTYSGAPWNVRLACRLLREMKNSDASEWAPYIKILPKVVEAPTTTFEWDDIASIEDEGAKERIYNQNLMASQAFDRVPSEAHSASSREEFEWALSIANSRTFRIDSGIRMLVPIVDMANHRGSEATVSALDPYPGPERCNMDWRVDEKGRFVLFAKENIPKDTELTLTYGPKNNDDFFAFYGFVPKANSLDSVSIFPALMDMLQWHRATSASPALPPITYVKALTTSQQYLQETGAGGLRLYAHGGIDQAMYKALEVVEESAAKSSGGTIRQRIRGVIRRRASELLQEYSTTILEDLSKIIVDDIQRSKENLQESPESPNLKALIQLKVAMRTYKGDKRWWDPRVEEDAKPPLGAGSDLKPLLVGVEDGLGGLRASQRLILEYQISKKLVLWHFLLTP